MDTDNDGIVSIEELKSGLRNFGSQLAESEVQMLIEAVGVVALYSFKCIFSTTSMLYNLLDIALFKYPDSIFM